LKRIQNGNKRIVLSGELIMKEVYRNGDIVAYSGFKDAFSNKMYVVINETLKELRLYGKYKDFKIRRKALERSGLIKLFENPEYGIVIDITETTKRNREKLFPGYRHSEWQIVGKHGTM